VRGRHRQTSSNIGEKMKAKIGNVLEIPTKKGIAYVQYTHETEYGGVVRVLNGVYDQPLNKDSLCKLATEPHEFIAIIPVTAAVWRKIFIVAAHCDIPESARSHPIFRSSKDAYEDYFLWDGEEKWSKDELSEDEKKYPILSIWNDTLLIERIEEGWRPQKEFE